MKQYVLALAIAACLTGIAPTGGSIAFAEDTPDKVVPFADSDAEMNAAIAKARSRLAIFWQKFAKPGPGEESFSLKIEITDGGASEHFWCSEIEGDASKATCRIANEPQWVKTVAFGQRIDVDPARISDWMYRLEGKIKGGETIRVIVARMPAEEAAQYRAILAAE